MLDTCAGDNCFALCFLLSVWHIKHVLEAFISRSIALATDLSCSHSLSLCLCHARMPRKFRIDFFLMWLIRVWKQQHDTDRQNKLYICFDCCYCIFYTVSNKRNKLPKFRTPDRNPNALSKLFCGSSGLLLIRAKRERREVERRFLCVWKWQSMCKILWIY